MNREPSFDELVGAETSGEERERLRHVHDLLLEAGPPPELTPKLRKAPVVSGGVVRMQRRRVVKRRGLLLLAAALSIVVVFAAGYAVSNSRHGGSSSSTKDAAATILLRGTKAVPNARATLEVWEPKAGNWPMTLSVTGLPKLPPHAYYYVYLVRDGKPWAPCGAFRVASASQTLTLTMNAPYKLRRGDTWVVTQPAAHGTEPGKTVLHPVSA